MIETPADAVEDLALEVEIQGAEETRLSFGGVVGHTVRRTEEVSSERPTGWHT